MTDEGEMGVPVLSMKKADKAAMAMLVILGLLLVGGTLWGLSLLMPLLVELAKNTIIFFAELVVLALFAMIALQAFMARDALYYKFKLMARNVRKTVVREDPIGVLDTVIHRLSDRLEHIDEKIRDATAAATRQQNVIKKADADSDTELRLAAAARKIGKPDTEISGHAAKAERWTHMADSLRPLAEQLSRVQTYLERARDLCASRLDDLRNQKEVLAVQLDAMKEGQQAVHGFKQFFGSNADLDMQDLALEEIERQSTEAEAEIDQFMRNLEPVLEGQDLKKNAEAMAAMDKFNHYLETGGQKALPTVATTTGPVPIKQGEVVPMERKEKVR